MFPSTKTWVRATAHAITAASLIVFIILAGNYYIEDASSEHREEVTVQQKFSRKYVDGYIQAERLITCITLQ